MQRPEVLVYLTIDANNITPNALLTHPASPPLAADVRVRG